MNGRFYDPHLGRFLSPDNGACPANGGVQLPDFTQNFNRYSYCLNNPLVYTDPSGEIVWFVPIIIGASVFGTGNLAAQAIRGDVDNFWDGFKYFGQGALAGAVLGAAWQFAPLIPGIGQGIQTGMNIYGAVQLGSAALSTVSGLGQGIFTGDWSALGNAGQLFLGNFYIDENKSFFGGVWQGISRHTWEYPQTLLGHSSSQIINTLGRTRSVSYYGGATVSETYGDNWGAITMGSYIIGSRGITADPNNSLFQHEYGHYLQSQASGLMYLSKYGIPSALSHDPHDQHPAEQDANARALTYFNRHISGYAGWRHRDNPINGYNAALGFNDPVNQAAINGARLRLGWYDYLMLPLNATFIGIPIPGLINALILNKQY